VIGPVERDRHHFAGDGIALHVSLGGWVSIAYLLCFVKPFCDPSEKLVLRNFSMLCGALALLQRVSLVVTRCSMP
jgi:hypothetical protein